MGGLKLSDVGEEWIVDFVLSRLRRFGRTELPIGDDAAAERLNTLLAFTTDMLNWSTDAPPGMSEFEFGFKSITSAVSDLAAKGATPRLYLVSLGLRGSYSPTHFVRIWEGIESAVDYYGGRIVGGDVNESDEPIIDCACIGEAKRLVSRNGARPGDLIAVSGLFGAHAAGLDAALKGRDDELSTKLKELSFNPRARLWEGIALVEADVVSSMIDSSDGLAVSLHELAKASCVGMIIDSPPIHPLAEEYASLFDVELYDLVFYGGEEFELVFTVPDEKLREAEDTLSNMGSVMHVIGRVTSEKGMLIVKWSGEERLLERGGWEHFLRA